MGFLQVNTHQRGALGLIPASSRAYTCTQRTSRTFFSGGQWPLFFWNFDMSEINLGSNWKQLAEAVAFEKNLPTHRVMGALEQALASLALKNLGEEGQCRIDGLSEGNPQAMFHPEEGGAWEPIPMPPVSRTSAQWVKQALYQNLRQALRAQAHETWKDREGELVIGMVKRSDYQRTHLDLGNGTEGVLERAERLPGEFLKAGQSVKAVVKAVSLEGSGPVVRLSRASERFVVALFEREVPELANGQLQIAAVARRAGQQTKIAVEPRLGFRGEPVATLVGMRGMRVQAVAQELRQERLDIMGWHEAIADRIVAALGTQGITRLVINEDSQSALVGVTSNDLARVMGRGGMNVQLASRLTGWSLEALEAAAIDQRVKDDNVMLAQRLMEALHVDFELAEALVEEGIENVHALGALEALTLQATLEGLDESDAEELILRARMESAKEVEKAFEADHATRSGRASLAALGLAEEHIDELFRQNIHSAEALADLSIHDLLPWKGVDRQRLGDWIMAARESCWEIV